MSPGKQFALDVLAIYYLGGMVFFAIPTVFFPRKFLAKLRQELPREQRPLVDSPTVMTLAVMIAAMFWPFIFMDRRK